MASNIVKCVNCNVVIDELLAFIVNKVDVMDNESLFRVCAKSFTVEEVENSKKLLFESITTDIRNVKRKKKGDGKIQKDLEDIVTVIKSTDPEKVPIFVAKELHKLPPVTFDHIDVTVLLKKLLLMESQVEDFKNNYATKEQLAQFETKLYNKEAKSLLNTPKSNKFVNIKKRGECIIDTPSIKSPVVAPLPLEIQTTVRDKERQQSRSLPYVNEFECESALASLTEAAVSNENNIGNLNRSFADIAGSSHVQTQLDKWIEVKKKKRGQQGISKFSSAQGKAVIDRNSKFKAADTKIPLFITNVHKDASEADVAEYIKTKTQQEVVPIKIKMAMERNYSAFKFFVSKYDENMFLDESLWPKGISFRRFVNMRDRPKQQLQVDNDNKRQSLTTLS